MIHLVYGGSGSGKSAFAEQMIMNLNARNRYYLATMKVFGEEGKKRVERHRKLREGKGFATIECETLDGLLENVTSIEKKDSVVLLECLSNLTANEMFKGEKIIPAEEVCEKICQNLEALVEMSDDTVIVSNNVFEDGIEYHEDTKKYMEALGKINDFVAHLSDRVSEVVCGIPLELKK